jgi:hypothetical protein
MILGRLSRPISAPATPVVETPAPSRPRIDYDFYRAEARRLRNQAIGDVWRAVSRLLKRMVTP